MLNKQVYTHCPRCKTAFECKAGSISICQCTAITLNAAELNYIKTHFDNCLCADCMRAMKADYQNFQLQQTLNSIPGVHLRPSSNPSTDND